MKAAQGKSFVTDHMQVVTREIARCYRQRPEEVLIDVNRINIGLWTGK
jgi:hypothetical protein